MSHAEETVGRLPQGAGPHPASGARRRSSRDAGGRPPVVLVADSLGRSFGGRRVLSAATLRACRGEVTVLFGRNGSGKTTALRIAAGRLRAHWGTVRFLGRAVLRPRLHRLAREGLLYIPQEGLLVRDWVVGDQARLLTGASEARIREWAERWHVADFLPREARSLSGGERNRVSVALAVLREPVCLLLDEPLTGSAPKDRERIAEMMRHLARRGCAILVTGHEARDLLALADRVLLLSAGATRELGDRHAALADEAFRREYLGTEGPASGRSRKGLGTTEGRTG